MFGVHCVGGIVGALLTGVFCDPSLGGTGVYDYVANAVGEYSMGAQVKAQLWGVGVTLVWSGVVASVAFKIVDLVIGLRVTEDEEREGLDTAVARRARVQLTESVEGGRFLVRSPSPPLAGASAPAFFCAKYLNWIKIRGPAASAAAARCW